MDNIFKCLKELGYSFYEENCADVYNDYLKILITYSEEKNIFYVRYALLSYFDRWANSGYEKEFNSKEEVIAFLKNESELLTEAMSELIYDIIEEACNSKNKKTILNKLNNMLQEFNNTIF